MTWLSCGYNVSGEIAAILGARVGGMRAKRVKPAARMLPDTAPGIPMEAKQPKTARQPLAFGRAFQPNPLANHFGSLVLSGKLRPQVIQDHLRRQSAVFAVFDEFIRFSKCLL